jgi:hypothetical protein
MGRRIFVSYSRDDIGAIDELVRHLEAAGNDVWIDRRIGGGHDWWNTILAEIRGRDLFVVAVSKACVESVACAAELRYASALGRYLVPVSISSDVSGRRLPAELARIQMINYVNRTPEAAIGLTRAIDAAPSSVALPEPLPVPPPVPMSYMVALQERLASSDPMTSDEQASTVMRLRASLRDEGEASDARALLSLILRRSDLLASSQREITDALATAPLHVSLVSQPNPGPLPAPGFPPPGAIPSKARRNTGVIVGVSAAAAAAVAAIVGVAVAVGGPHSSGGSTPVSAQVLPQAEQRPAEKASTTTTRDTTTIAAAKEVAKAVAPQAPARPATVTRSELDDVAVVASEFPYGPTTATQGITLPCSESPALGDALATSTGSRTSDDATYDFASQTGVFASSGDATAFVAAVGRRGRCSFTHSDGTQEQDGSVQTPALPPGYSSTIISYTLLLPNGTTVVGQDAYISLGRFVSVFVCIGQPNDSANLTRLCSAYGSVVGSHLDELYAAYQ